MKKNLKRALAIMLALLLTGSAFADYYVSAQADETGEIDGKNGFHVSGFEVFVDGKPLEECDSVYAGAEVTVHFQWSLDNDVQVSEPFKPQTYEINTQSPEFVNSGIDFSQMTAGTVESPGPLIQNGETVGSYYIQDGIIYITISEERVYNNESNRQGGVYFYGKIAKDGDKTNDGTKKDIGFGTVSSNVTYYDSADPSSASVWKNVGGSIFSENGKYYQTFQAGVRVSNGKVTGITLKDIVSPEDKLSYVPEKKCKITDSSVEGLSKDVTYDSLEELFAAINRATFYENDSVTFEYTMEVDPSIFDYGQNRYSNSLEGAYTSNRGENKSETNPATAYVQVTKPSINKTATGYADGKVSWTITVNVGDLYEEGKNSLSDYFASVTDIPGQGLPNTEQEISLTLNDFRQNPSNKREFTYTYETEVLPEVKDSITDQTIKNSAKMTNRDGKIYPSNEAQYTIEKNGVELEKSFIEEKDGIITWEIKVSGLTKGVETLCLKDDLGARKADHDLLDWLKVDDMVVRENGSFKQNPDQAVIEEDSFDFNEWYSKGISLTFTDEYVKKSIEENGGVIILWVKSKIMPYEGEDGLHEYLNDVKGSYQSAGSTQDLPSVQASYTDATDILSKTGTTSGQEVEYEITVPTQYLDIQTGGKGFEITDILDKRMQYVEDSVRVTLGNIYYNENVKLQSSEYSYSLSTTDNAITFRIPVTDKLVNELQDNYILAIHYKAKYKDLAELVTNEEAGKNIENNAKGTYNEKEIGDSKALNDLAAPQSIISKEADYDKSSAPFVTYTVEINPDALTLLGNGAKLKAEDTLSQNGALIFANMDSSRFAGLDPTSKENYQVKVYEWTTTSNDYSEWLDWVELEPSEYTYSFKSDYKLSFELPDSKHLKIVYYGYTVAAPGTRMDSTNSTNTFKLSGISTEATQGSHAFNNREVENYGYVMSDPGSITIFKYWTDGAQQLALTGSVFKIVSVKYDATTGKWVEDSVLKENICIPEDERENSDRRIQIDGLPLRKWMALYEVEADTGYAINKKPYYFYINDPSVNTAPTDRPDGDATVFEEMTANEVKYRNYKAASLQLEKTIVGDVTREEAEGALRFTVTDPDGGKTTYTLSDFSYDSSSGKWTLLLERLMPGEYKVEETEYNIDGKEVISVKYSLNNGSTWSSGQIDAQATVTLGEEGFVTVTYQNTYPNTHTDTFPVKISKRAILGGTDEIPGARFIIRGGVYGTEGRDWISGTESEELNLLPGEYTLEEYAAPQGYKREKQKVTFTVKDDGTIEIISGELVDNNTIVMRDEPLDVEVDKVELTNQDEVPGATLTLYDKSHLDEKGNLRTDVTGNLLPEDSGPPTWVSAVGERWQIGKYLKAGHTYVLVETNAPKGYAYSERIEFTVGDDGGITIISGNGHIDTTTGNRILMEDKAISIKLSKLTLAGTELAGAEIGLYKASDLDDNGRPKANTSPIGDTWISGSEPFDFAKGRLEAGGQYALVEMDPPSDDYELAESIYFDVGKDGNIVVYGEAGNDLGGTAEAPVIKMYDMTKAEQAERATLVLRKTIDGVLDINDDDILDKIGNLTFTVSGPKENPERDRVYTIEDFLPPTQTRKSYELTVSDLTPGTYTVTESGYDVDGVNCTVTYTIEAVGASGAPSDREEGTGEGTRDIEFQGGGKVIVTYNNNYSYEMGKIRLTKSYESSGNVLDWNAISEKLTFRIYEVASTGIKKEIVESPILGTSSRWQRRGTDNAYECEIAVKTGDYIIEETYTTIAGYDRTTSYRVTAADGTTSSDFTSGNAIPAIDAFKVEEGKATAVEFVNKYVRNYPISISKRDINGTEELEGAKLTVAEILNDGSIREIAHWTSGEQGKDVSGKLKPYELTLKPGRYKLTETLAPQGYALAQEAIEFEINDKGEISITVDETKGSVEGNTLIMKDAPLDIQVSKVDITGTKEVDGATLVVYHEDDVDDDGNPIDGRKPVVEPWISEKGQPKDIGSFLEVNKTYVLIEKGAPKGYAYSESIKFTVKPDGSISTDNDKKYQADTIHPGSQKTTPGNRILMEDKAISIHLNKVELSDHTKELEGALIRIYHAEDVDSVTGRPTNPQAEVVDEWVSESGGPHEFGKSLEAGNDYVFVETAAPKGYDLATSIFFTVKRDGSVEVTGNVATTVVQNERVYLMEDGIRTSPSAELQLTKTVEGEADPADIIKTNLGFLVESTDLDQPYREAFYVGRDGFGWDGEQFVLTIYNLDPGTYKVTEFWDDSNSSGIVCKKQSWNLVLHGNGIDTTPDITGITTKEFRLEDGFTAELEYTNTYEKGGVLVITKTIKGDVTKEELEGTLQFTVTNNDTKKTNTYTLEKDFTYNSETKTWTKELSLTAGGYTVEESVKALDGKTCVTTYTINGGDSQEGRKAGNVVLAKGGTVTLAYTNDYDDSQEEQPPKKDTASNTSKKKSGGSKSSNDSVLTEIAQTVATALTKTGDSAPIGAWLLLLAFGVAGAVGGGYALNRRRKKGQRENSGS